MVMKIMELSELKKLHEKLKPLFDVHAHVGKRVYYERGQSYGYISGYFDHGDGSASYIFTGSKQGEWIGYPQIVDIDDCVEVKAAFEMPGKAYFLESIHPNLN